MSNLQRSLITAYTSAHRVARWVVCAVALTPLLLVAACESESLRPDPAVSDVDFYWDLRLNHHAVTLSTTPPYDTLQLVATPRNRLGDPLAGLPAPTYRSTIPASLVARANGLLVATKASSQSITVIAELTVGNVKHEDTVLVRIVDNPTPPVLTTFSIQRPDSAKVAMGMLAWLSVQAADAVGNPIENVHFHLGSSDAQVAAANNEVKGIQGRKVGTVEVYASTTVFGVSKADTALYRIGLPITGKIKIEEPAIEEGAAAGEFVQADYLLGTGATVLWLLGGEGGFSASVANSFEYSSVLLTNVEAVFADANLPNVVAPDIASLDAIFPGYLLGLMCSPGLSTDCGGGNIALGGGLGGGGGFGTTTKTIAIRKFTVPGTYEYRSPIHGTSGRIVVVDER